MLFNGDDTWDDKPIYKKHDIRWYETGANRRAARYFDKYYGIEWDDIRNPRSKDIEPRLVFELEYLESLPDFVPVNLNVRYTYRDTLLGSIFK